MKLIYACCSNNLGIYKSTVPLFLFCFVITNNYADTSEQAEQLNQRYAPCHGLFGQGTAGENSPRLAGLPAWYLSKATKDYKKNSRKNALMTPAFRRLGLPALLGKRKSPP